MPAQRRLIFDECAAEYDRLRPGYPSGMYDQVFGLIGGLSRVLEVGCGTGKATRALLARGCTVLAVEPGRALAALAQATLADPRFEVIEGDFEAFESPDLFDIIWAAQSWHWVPADPGFRLARSLLHDHGRLVLVWNWVVGSSIDLQPAYVRHYGDDAGSPPGPIDGAIEEVLQDIEASGHFDAPRVIRVPWSTEIGAEDYAALMDTWSPVRSIAEGKEEFLAHIRELIDAAGGTVRRDFECVAFICEPVR